MSENLEQELKRRPDISSADAEIIREVRPLTMTSVERIAALIDSVRYISNQKIDGDIVECGVWRGGSMVATALALIEEGDTERQLYLYDTFEGMPAPDDTKDHSFDGVSASDQLAMDAKGNGVWCEASLKDVKHNVLKTGYPKDKIHFVKGRIEETVPKIVPNDIALLRLDTDWYASTIHELRHLYPLITRLGVLIVDDYGHWKGSREACDEYFGELARPPLFVRIDYTGRIAQIC
jgi:O-methyltransferase